MKNALKNTIGILLVLFAVLLFGCKEDEITNISAETVVIDQSDGILELNPKDSIKLTATVMPDNAGNSAVLWKTSSARIASVTGEGWLKAERPGQATITAIAYSNTEIRNSISVKVNGLPEDVVSGVVGTYTGVLDIPGVSNTPDAELTLAQDQGDFYSVRLITEVDLTNVGYGIVPINILTGVDREGDKYRISGEGQVPQIGLVSVNGTVDADGNINLEIYVANFDATATYVGKNIVNIEEIVTGTYMGDVVAGAPVGSNVTVIITREENKYKLKIDDIIAGYPFQTEIEIMVSQSGNNLAISSEPGTATVAGNPTQVTITSGTITAAGAINFDIEIIGLTMLGAPSNTATYSGQKSENLAKIIAGTYAGTATVPMPGMPPIPATIILTRSGDQVILTSTVDIPTMNQLVLDIPMDISQNDDNYDITGNGNAENYGTVQLDGTVNAAGHIDLTIGVMGISVTFTGDKQ